VIGAELHLNVKTVLWQERTAWQEGSDSVAGNGDVLPAPVSQARRSTFPAGFRVRRYQGSPPDRNLGCSKHQAMSSLVQPGLHKNIYCIDIFTLLFFSLSSPSISTNSALPVLLNLHCIKTWSSHLFFQYFLIVHKLEMFQRIRMKGEKNPTTANKHSSVLSVTLGI